VDWIEFVLALGVFLLSHAVPGRPPVRSRVEGMLGARGFTLAYSVLSMILLAWLVGAAGRAPYVELWGWAPWQNHVVLTVMLPVCLIVALAVGRPNPFSFGGACDDRFNPARPGIVRWVRHPLLAALALWAGAHMLANGDLAHVLMFGTFAVFAILGQRLINRRKRRIMGAEWDRLRAEMAARRWTLSPDKGIETALRVVAGIALYAALLAFHPILFGVSPLP
jgi:uncharacterized membrane protein